MTSQGRTSLGFLFVGILGVLIGALVVTFAVPKMMRAQQAATGSNIASAAPLARAALPDEFEQRVIRVVKDSEPSVVLIKSTLHGVQQMYNPLQNDPFFRQFFGNQMPQSQPFTVQGSGSGFIVKRQGDTAFVATNAHVVYHADKVQVLLWTGRQVDAEVVGSDLDADLAILKIRGSNLPPALPMGNSSALQQGQFVLAIGEPESFQNTVSLGIVSALHRGGIDASGGDGFPTFHYNDMIQITTPINPGSSGGPLITTDGQVIGINAVVAPEAQGIGFSIPISTAQPVLAEIESTGHSVIVQHPFIGIQMRSLDSQIAQYLGYSGSQGVVVTDVVAQSPAEKAGLQSGDIILQMNHQKVTNPDQIQTAVSKLKVGDKIMLLVWRGGNLQPFGVTLGQRPDTLQG